MRMRWLATEHSIMTVVCLAMAAAPAAAEGGGEDRLIHVESISGSDVVPDAGSLPSGNFGSEHRTRTSGLVLMTGTPEVDLQRFPTLDGEHGEAKMYALQACTVFYGFAIPIPRQNAIKRDRMRQVAKR